MTASRPHATRIAARVRAFARPAVFSVKVDSVNGGMGLRDKGLRDGLKAASGVASKARGASGAAGGEARKGQNSIVFKKSFGQHILKNPLVRAAAVARLELRRLPVPRSAGSAHALPGDTCRLWIVLWRRLASSPPTWCWRLGLARAT